LPHKVHSQSQKDNDNHRGVDIYISVSTRMRKKTRKWYT
jgi:hypothetical protein